MSVGFHIASAWVDIRAEDKGLRQQVTSIVKKAAAGQDIKVQVKIDAKGLRSELTRAMKEASKGQATAIPVRIDSKGLRNELSRAMKEAAKGQKFAVNVGIDSKGLRSELNRAVAAASTGQKAEVNLGINSAGLRSELNRAISAATAGQGAKIDNVHFSTAGLRGELNRAIMAASAGQGVNIPVHFDNSSIRNELSSVNRALTSSSGHMSRWAKIAMAAFTLVPPAISVVMNGLRAMGPATGVLVSQFMVLSTVFATLMVGGNNVGTALGAAAAGGKKYEAALAKLTPSAKDFVQTLVSTKGAFKDLQLVTQETLFRNLGYAIGNMSSSVMPELTIGLGGMAMVLNKMALGVMKVTTQLAATGTLRQMFGGIQLAMEPLVRVPGQIVNALVKIGTAGMPVVIAMNRAFGDWANTMTTKLNRAFDDGRLQAGISKSAKSIHDFFSGLANNPEMQKFMDHMKSMGPEMTTALGRITEAVAKLMNNTAPLVAALIQIAGGFARMITSLPDGFITTILSLVTALKLLVLTAKGLEALRGIAVAMGLIGASSRASTAGLAAASGAGRSTATVMDMLGLSARRASASMATLGAGSAISGLSAAGVAARNSSGSMALMSASSIRTQAALGGASIAASRAAQTTQVLSGASIRGAAAGQAAAGAATAANRGFTMWAPAALGAAASTSTLATRAKSAGAAMGGMAKGLGVAAIGVMVLGPALNAVTGHFRQAPPSIDSMNTALTSYGRTGVATGSATQALGKHMSNLTNAFQNVVHPSALGKIESLKEKITGLMGIKGIDGGGLKGLIGSVLGLGNSSGKAQGLIKSMDGSLADLVKSGNGELAAAAFKKYAGEASKAGLSTEDLKKKLPQYKAAMDNAREAQQVAAQTMGIFGQKALEVQTKLGAYSQSVKGLQGSYGALNGAAQNALGGQIEFAQAQQNLKQDAQQNAGALKMVNGELQLNSDSAINAAGGLRQMAGATQQSVEATIANGGSWEKATSTYEKGRASLISAAVQMGLTKAQAKKLADQILQMPDKKIMVQAQIDGLDRQIDTAQAKVDSLKQKRKTAVGADKARLDGEINKAQGKVDSLKQKKKTAIDAYIKSFTSEINKAQGVVDKLKQKRKTAVGADKKDIDNKISAAQRKVDSLKQKRAAAIKALDKTGPGVDSAKRRIASVHGKTVTISVVGIFKGVDESTKAASNAIAKQAKDQAAKAKGKATGGIIRRAMGGMLRRASGGEISGAIMGPGGPTSDSIMAALSNGEFVVKTAAVQKYGLPFLNAINNGQYPKFAAGGSVASKPAAPAKGAGAAKPAAKPGAGTGTAPAGGGGGVAPVVFTAVDATKAAADSAKANIMSIPLAQKTAQLQMQTDALAFGTQYNLNWTLLGTQLKTNWAASRLAMQLTDKAAYTGMAVDTSTFSASQVAQYNTLGTTSKATWSAMGLGLQTTTGATYANLGSQTAAFGTNQVGKLNATRTASHATWESYKGGMSSRTNATYSIMNGQTNAWGQSHQNKLAGVRTNSHATWESYKGGMSSRTNATYSIIKGQTNAWGGAHQAKLNSIRTASHATWESFKGGMNSRTNATYSLIKGATNSFGSQTTSKFNQIKNSVGAAWDGVRPKLAAPIKYLINKVINSGVVPAMNTVVNKLGGSGNLGKISSAGFATGGYVSGPGTATSDSIPARLSNGEFVMRSQAVRQYGVSYLNSMNAGNAGGRKEPVGRAGGGIVGLAGGGLAMVTGASKDKLEKMLGKYSTGDYEKLADWIWDNAIEPLLDDAPGGSAMGNVLKSGSKLMKKQATGYLEANIPNPNLVGGNVADAVKFADAQIGKPYQYGGGMDPSFDCSSFMSSIAKVIMGQDPHGRAWSTMDFQGNSAPTGWKRNQESQFKIGVTNGPNNSGGKEGHTAGTLAGVNYEATPPRLRKGPGARGYKDSMFDAWYGFSGAVGGLGNYKPGAGVAQWTEVTKQALGEAGQSLSLVNTVLHQMDTESSGNPRAVNLTDSNAQAGYPSVGLMQVIRPTFQAYAGKHKGAQPQMYGVSIDPLANIFSSIKYVLAQYGSVAKGMRGVAYASGGPVKGPGTGTSDSIAARLSNGEYVMQNSAVRKYGTRFMNDLNQGAFGFATGGSVGSTYTVKSGDTLSGIAQKFNTTVSKLAALNNIQNKNMINIGQILKINGSATTTYLIKAGDTLSGIAKKFGTTVAILAALNHISNPDKINAGTTIHLPGGSGSGGGPTPPPPPPWMNLKVTDAEKAATAKTLVTNSTYGEWAAGTDADNYLTKFTASIGGDMSGLLDSLEAMRHGIDDSMEHSAGEKALIVFLDANAKKAIDFQKSLATVTTSLTDATASLASLQQNFDSLKSSVSQSVMSFGGISKVAKYGTSVQTIITQLQTDVSKSTEFASQLEQLKAKGINGDVIQQIANMGATGGGGAAATSLLTASTAQIAQLNSLQTQLGTVADRTGTAAADAMYGAGVHAAQGIVDGLTSQKDAIEAAMLAIGKSMEKAIKQALGIASPSKVMRKLFKFVPLGAAEGVLDGMGHVDSAIREMVSLPASGLAKPAVQTNTGNSGTMHGCGNTYIIQNMNVQVDANIDLNKPTAARDFAKAIGPAMKDELRRSDRERR